MPLLYILEPYKKDLPISQLKSLTFNAAKLKFQLLGIMPFSHNYGKQFGDK